jgi:hypothetical protein
VNISGLDYVNISGAMDGNTWASCKRRRDRLGITNGIVRVFEVGLIDLSTKEKS